MISVKFVPHINLTIENFKNRLILILTKNFQRKQIEGKKKGPQKLRMGGKKGKKVKSTHSKKGKTKESKNCTKSPLQEEDQGEKENVSSQEDFPGVEKATSDLHIDEETEIKIVDVKNNNATPIKCEDPTESGDTVKTIDVPKIFSSPGLDRRKSFSNQEIHSPPTEKSKPTEVRERDSLNYNNNLAQKISKDQKDGVGTPKKVVPMKHPLEHSWTLW